MPVVQISSNISLTGQEKQALLIAVARLVSKIMEKPIQDVMVALTGADFVMMEDFGPAAFIDIRCLSGLEEEGVKACLCEGLRDVLQQCASLDPDRVYVNFFEVSPDCAWRFRDGVPVCPKIAMDAR